MNGAAEDQHGVRQHRANERSLHHRGQAVPQGEDAEEQLGQIAERRLQQSRGARTDPLAHLLDGLADEGGQGRQGQASHDEPEDRVGPEPGYHAREDRERHRRTQRDPVSRVHQSQSSGERHGRHVTVAARHRTAPGGGGATTTSMRADMPGGVAEWFRQGPAKPCTPVRFRSPPP